MSTGSRYVDDQFYDCGRHCLSANPVRIFALDGLSQLIYTINLIKKKLNKSLEIEGVVFTMYDARTNLSLEVVENVKNNLDQFIYKTIIPRNVRLAEAPSFGLPINLYDSRSSGAQGYRDLADEVINNKLYAKL